MKSILLAVACFAVIVRSQPLFGLEGLGNLARVGADVGSRIGSALGTGADLGMEAAADLGAGALSLGTGAIEAGAGAFGAGARAIGQGARIATGIGRRIGNSGLGIAGLGAQQAARNSERASSSDANQYNRGASGADSQGYRNRGEKEFHDRGHHHSSVSKVEKADNSDEHDVGGHQAYDQGAHKSGEFNKYGSGASKAVNDVARAAQQEVEDDI
ncbi:uncharacterized protein LOC133319505 [Danaus plexippus]|uniref:uncharacterized protein LOC133319505 n=1 Tax=Danaus plexippus TaxID=13037 RepID=UPI002AB2DE7D|nr:uncharacterized protein LOC133319505 [Danaus plexippus]